ncbi:MAG: GLUG motif-containing protein, partial [Hydrogenoanaerobacterium sp.]
MKNRILSMVLAVCMAFTMMPVAAFAETAQIPQGPHSHPSIDSGMDNSVGSGIGSSIDSGKAAATRQAKAGAWDGNTKTEVTPTTTGGFKTYTVNNGAELAWIAQEVNLGNNADFINPGTTVKLAAGINLGGHPWTPIGNTTHAFACKFTGINGTTNFTVSSFKTDSAAKKQGLFGTVGSNGKIDNLTVNGAVEGTYSVGGIAGYNNGTITGCNNSGTVSGSGNIGGIVGENEGTNGTITNCNNSGTVNGDSNNIGGITGRNNNGTIQDCSNTGDVTGTAYTTAGITGINVTNNSIIKNCSNSGAVKGSKDYTGGIVGDNRGKITSCSCSNTSTVTGTDNVGGIAGINYATVEECYNTGAVKGKLNVGGIAGTIITSPIIKNCYNTGTVTGTNKVGGIAGNVDTNASVINCVSLGLSVSGNSDKVGRVAGTALGTLTNNKARSDMLVNGAPVAATDANNGDGIDVSKNPKLPDIFTDFDAAIWYVYDTVIMDRLPTLKNVAGPRQVPELPKRPQTEVTGAKVAVSGSYTYTGASIVPDSKNLTVTDSSGSKTY